MGRLFGTDGVRGIAGSDLTADLARRLGRATVEVLAVESRRPVLVIGRDPRESGTWLEEALVEDRVEAVLRGGGGPAAERGAVRELEGGRERYLRHLVAAAGARLEGLSIVVDCANGAASDVGPELYARLGASVRAINDAPDGRNINVGSGALHPDVVGEAVVEIGADAGVSHDGDADRALFTDRKGALVDGDQVLAACAIAMKEAGELPGDRVVTTVMANIGFHKAMHDAGITVSATKVGDRYVLEEMIEEGAALGGEQSGHVIFRDHATTGDGLLTAARFLSLAATTGRSVENLAATMRRYPQVMENVRVRSLAELDGSRVVREAVREAEEQLAGTGRVLVRASGTEPLV